MADEEDIITTQPATPAPSEPQYVNAWDDILAEHEKTLERQKVEDQQRIDKLSKGRAYWIGANMLANVFAEAINAWGTGNGAPAMQLPEYNNEYMKLWKEADDRRHVNYQRMKDQYDRLRVGQLQREQQIADTKNQRAYTEQQQQNAWDRELNRRDWQEQEKDKVRNRSIEQVKALHPDWTDIQAEAYVDQKLIPDDYRRKLAKEEEDRRIREYEGRENAKQKAKVFYSGTGKDENNLYVSDGIGEDIIITGKDRSDKKKNIGLVSAIIKEKLDEMFPEVTDEDIWKEKDEDKKKELKKMKTAYDAFVASNKRTDWTNLDEKDIQYYIKKYNLLDEDLRHQLRQIAKSDVSERKNTVTSDYIYPRVKTMEEIYRENRSSGNEHTDKPKIIY